MRYPEHDALRLGVPCRPKGKCVMVKNVPKSFNCYFFRLNTACIKHSFDLGGEEIERLGVDVNQSIRSLQVLRGESTYPPNASIIANHEEPNLGCHALIVNMTWILQ